MNVFVCPRNKHGVSTTTDRPTDRESTFYNKQRVLGEPLSQPGKGNSACSLDGEPDWLMVARLLASLVVGKGVEKETQLIVARPGRAGRSGNQQSHVTSVI